MENRLQCRNYGVAGAAAAVASPGSQRHPSIATPISGAAMSQEGAQSTFQQSVVGPSHTLLGVARADAPASNSDAPAPAKRARKERGANWNSQEVNALIEAKRNLFLDELDSIDGRDLMTPEAGKWLRISADLAKARVSPCHRDGAACKTKWNQLIPEYKKIVDYFARTGTNEITYWDLTAAQRKTEGLPRSFAQDVFYHINDWYGSRPTIMPPHTRDLLSTDDSNYKTPLAETEDAGIGDDSDFGDEDPIATAPPLDSDNGTASTQSPMAEVGSGKARAMFGVQHPPPTASPIRAAKGIIPPGVTPQVLSSSDTADSTVRRKLGNTGVRRKSLSGQSLIAEATRATGEAMTGQMKDMALASQDLERSKIDVQLRLFTEKMDYQRERDRRLHENARLVNDNAKLAIEKQSEVVQCLADLSTVLSVGFGRGEVPHFPRPTTAIPDDGPHASVLIPDGSDLP